MKLFVTGGAGFMGGDFCRHMLSRGAEILCLDALTYAANREALKKLREHPNFTFAEGNICDGESVQNLIREYRPQVLVNFAAESHVDSSFENPLLFEKSNVEGVLTLLDCCRVSGLPFHQISTDEVYGDTPLDSTVFFDESSPLRPGNPYAATKAAADLLTLSYVRSYGIRATISRACNNYGENQHREKFVPKMLERALKNEPLTLYGNGENIREWLYVGDHSLAIECILAKGMTGEVYNISSNAAYSNNQMAKLILEATGSSSEVEYIQNRPGHDLRYAMNSNKLKALGFSAATELTEKIKTLL